MGLKIGIDVGGTFTDFMVAEEGQDSRIHKVLSTPIDPSIAVIEGLKDISNSMDPPLSLKQLASKVESIVHGTTVTTNATLTRNGASTGLITTEGMRDALEMRRGIREEQYNNRCNNIVPLVPRYLRQGVGGRLDRNGKELKPLNLEDVKTAITLFKQEGVKAVSICFMNSFTNPEHEQQAAALVRKELPEAYLTVSSDLLPSIRLYERVSTTVLNSYIGPILDHYLNQLLSRLNEIGFNGILLIMQSNGGVMAPQVAREKAALTLLSGPAAGPGAGLQYVKAHEQENCIVVDMGGTSFEASLVVGDPLVINEGEIDRHKLSLPMLGIHTIGAGGGSIGWIDKGGLLRIGPESAGADPGPACYQKGGRKPANTDANLVLGYLNPDFFAGGSMKLDMDAARAAIDEHVATPMGRLSIEDAAAGMYRIACTNMAQGVREITIKRGFDPREFPLVVAGGAGPVHSCLICEELQIPLQIVPRESSILCAAGMLMSDLRHDFVRTYVATMKTLDWLELTNIVTSMIKGGDKLLAQEGIPETSRSSEIKLDCRYLRQYHEVSVAIPEAVFFARDTDAIVNTFHAEHNRLYGYSLEQEGGPIEVINVRVQVVGEVEKPSFKIEEKSDGDGAHAIKDERAIYIPSDKQYRTVHVYDGHKLKHGNHIEGPAMIEQITTAIFVGETFNCVIDKYGSFTLYRKDCAVLVASTLSSTVAGGHS